MKAQTPPSPQAPNGGARNWIVVALLIVFMAATAFVTVWWYQTNGPAAPYVADTRLMEFQVADERLQVRLNLVQQPPRSRNTVREKLNMTLLWPSLTGYSQEMRDAFLTKEGERFLIFATVEKRSNAVDMTNRLETVYVPLFEGTPRQGPAGLVLQTLKAGVGYDDEVIAVHADNSGVWAARCEKNTPSASPTCLRDFHFGKGLVFRYRFSTTLLKDWRKLEAEIRQKVQSWLVR